MRKTRILFIAFSNLLGTIACGQLPQATQLTHQPDQVVAFPGAEGFGKFTTGGRGGNVFIVTTLEDSGPGSLREALQAQEARTIIFAVSGTITLKSELIIRSGNLTIAGQSAPGDGICLRNYPVSVRADNVIIRYMRFRMGAEAGQQGDALGAIKHKNILIDHCSMSWATDECASFYDNTNFTLQWCIISESLNASVHEKGEHGYGGIWGGQGASFHHNLLANHNSRNPRFCGSRYSKQPDKEIVDFRNNVIFNWGINSAYAGEKGNHMMVNNYYKPGPATPESKKSRIVNPWQPYGKFYVAGNFVESNAVVSSQNWQGGVQCDHLDSVRSDTPFYPVDIKEQSARQAYAAVLSHAGASFRRDAVDQRITEQVKSGKAIMGKNKNGIIDSPSDVGGWPALKSLPSPVDTDRDGMPDSWEKTHRLNPKDPADATTQTLSSGYDNLEVYLNALVKLEP